MDDRLVTTITPNPAIDKTYWIDGFRPNRQNILTRLRTDPGGKGLNIARILQGFGLKVSASGFFGGVTGKELLGMLAQDGVKIDPVLINGDTRTNTKIIDPESGAETEINEPGPYISEAEQDRLRQYVREYAAKSEYMVFGGSLPRGCAAHFYVDLIQTAQEYDCKTILDASKAPLQEGIQAAPYLIKPNQHELSEVLGREIGAASSAAEAGVLLRKTYGIEVVVVSLGELGAVLAGEDGVFHAVPPKVRPQNTIGAGDSLVAGLIYGLVSGYRLVDCLRLGVACGTLAVTDQATSISKPLVKAMTEFSKGIEIKPLA